MHSCSCAFFKPRTTQWRRTEGVEV
jgi:hypothetical protein